MGTALDKSIQALADSTGILTDRSLSPEKTIGQCWVISKSRVVVPASVVSNYTEAPWALVVKFPYPDLIYSVKAISLHPDFSKPTARQIYLSQATEANIGLPGLDNDIATLILDQEIPELQPDKVLELNRALSLPLNIAASDLSGEMRAGDTGQVLQNALVSGRSGVLVFYDGRNIPFARILIRQGTVIRAAFGSLVNELAICELMWKKPGGRWALHSKDIFPPINAPDINTATDQLAAEAIRRVNELPKMIDSLGGPNVRYAKAKPTLDLSLFNPQQKWALEKVFPQLDAYLPLSKLSERAGVDTFTALQVVWELKEKRFANPSLEEPFHKSGQLGSPLTPGYDQDLPFYEPIVGFHLDEISLAPIFSSGNFFGCGNLILPKTILHTMTMPNANHGAALVKDGRIVGIHSGKFTPPPSANFPNFALSQAIWIGVLGEMSAKRLRGATDFEDHLDPDMPPPHRAGAATLTGIRVKNPTSEQNSAGSSQPAHSDYDNEPEFLRRFSKTSMFGLAVAVFILGLAMMAGSLFIPKSEPSASTASNPQKTVQTPVQSTTSVEPAAVSGGQNAGDESTPEQIAQAVDWAVQYANLKRAPVPPFEYESVYRLTQPKPSFGLFSEKSNMRLYFVLWPNLTPRQNLSILMAKVPFLEYPRSDSKIVRMGDSERMNWAVGRYYNKDNKDVTVFLGAIDSTKNGSCILVIAEPWSRDGDINYGMVIASLDKMFAEIRQGQEKTILTSEGATPEELSVFRKKVEDKLKSNFREPLDIEKARKCVCEFAISEDGSVSRVTLKETSRNDDMDKAVQRCITSSAPFDAVPRARTGAHSFVVTVDLDRFEVSEL